MQRPTSATGSVDYYSFTTSSEARSPLLEMKANRIMLDEARQGALPHNFLLHGYTGVRCGNVQVGRSDSRLWVSLIGELADPRWQDFHGPDVAVTRLDLAVTALFEPALPGLVRHEFSRLCALAAPGEKRKWSIVQGSDGGATLYIGSRKSERFGRLYDRGIKAKSHDIGQVWRWEVEYKGRAAQALADALAPCTELNTIASGYVCQWFGQRGVSTPPSDVPGLDYTPSIKRQGMAEDKLQWLTKQVAPSVLKLVSAGHRTDVLKALSLDQED